MIFDEDFPASSDALKHHGVKGQKWGVRHKDSLAGDSGSSKSTSASSSKSSEEAAKQEYLAIKPKTRTKAEAQKELAKNETKFAAKFQPPNQSGSGNSEKKGLTPQQKKLIKIGVTTAVVAGIVAYGVHSNNVKLEAIRQAAGKPITADSFQHNVSHSKVKTWMFGPHVQPESYDRKEFTLSAGHVFHRLSTLPESDFGDATYATHNIDDFNRYVTSFRQEKGSASLHHITFKSTTDIKIPSLTTTLETLREVMNKEVSGGDVSKESVLSAYHELSGGSWFGNRSSSLFSELGKKGYGAITDEMDAGVIGESPIVLFAKGVTSKVSNPLTNDAIQKAESSLIELKNRKGIGAAISHSEELYMTDFTLTEDALAHYGKKGMHWGVRRSDGGSISNHLQKRLNKSETRFQSHRSAANSTVAKNRHAGISNQKDQTKANKFNAQHRKNQAALKAQGLETYKNFPPAVKNVKASNLKKDHASTISTGRKVAIVLLAGPLLAPTIIRRQEAKQKTK